MVIRRIREHVTAHNWFAVGIDFLIVVAGIVIGTQVNNWNQSRAEAEQGRAYRARLIDELDFNTRQHRTQAAYYIQARNHGLAALDTLRSGKIDNPSKFLIDAYQLTQVDTSPAKSYIYNEMVSSGLVSRLGNDEVQRAASDYYLQVTSNDRAVQETHPYRNIVRSIVPYAVQAEIHGKCGDRAVYYRKRVIGVRLTEPCTARFDRASAIEGVANIRSEPNIERELVRYIGSINERLEFFRLSLALAANLETSLRANEGRS